MLRIATYNIHKCVGMDRRFSPERIVDVLREVDADLVALQEVLCQRGPDRREHQAAYLADALEMQFFLGENRRLRGGLYGNAILSRLPVTRAENHDISVRRREPRGCLYAEVALGETKRLHFFNVHMGTSYFERRLQVHKLLAEHVIDRHEYAGSRIVAGDFNEWTRGITTRLLTTRFEAVEARKDLGARRTFPGFLPLLHLDHIYFDKKFTLARAFVHKTRTALIASDHLPIVAEFEF